MTKMPTTSPHDTSDAALDNTRAIMISAELLRSAQPDQADVEGGIHGASTTTVRVPAGRSTQQSLAGAHSASIRGISEPTWMQQGSADALSPNGSGSSVNDLVDTRNAYPQLERVPSVGYEVLREWEGRVVSIDDGKILAQVVTIVGESQFDLAEFDVGQFSRSDLELIKPDAVVYWTVSKRTLPNGTIEHVEHVAVRRLPPPSRRMRRRVDEMVDFFLRNSREE